MGQKVNPIGMRLGINRTWDSRWFAERDYADLLEQDLKLRNHLKKRLSNVPLINAKRRVQSARYRFR